MMMMIHKESGPSKKKMLQIFDKFDNLLLMNDDLDDYDIVE